MFAILGAIIAGVWLILTFVAPAVAVAVWLHPLVLFCLCLHLALGPMLPFRITRE